MRKGVTGISGVSESRSAWVIAERIREQKGKSLIITATEPRARRLADDLSFFTKSDVHVMPAEDQVFLRYEARSHDRTIDRLQGMHALFAEDDCIVVAPASAAVKKTIPHRFMEAKRLTIARGEDHFLIDLKEQLAELGYERMSLVEGRGEFSIRGGILDVFTPEAEHPYRVEFFDTEVDSIRTFDSDTQRSLENLKSIEIGPAEQLLLEPELFQRAAARVHKAYTAQLRKLARKGEEYAETAHRLEKRRDELVEYMENRANAQLLENYIHYFYDETEYLWD